MASHTGIELGPDRCVLAGVRTAGSTSEIVALHTIDPDDWPAHDAAFTELLREVRKAKRFPRRTRVVAWGLPEDSLTDQTARAATRPIADAGFTIDRVVTPPQALAMIARTRRRPGVHSNGVVWLSLNTHGVAIAIVHGSDLLFARTFSWTYNPYLPEGKAQLLQRYTLIAHLEPEVRRGIAAVRASHGIDVDAAVTCGDLPELRSLTMPLIEELDLEVETLDSLDGMRPAGTARHERLAEYAPAIRLACAAALAPETRRRDFTPVFARIAAAAALVAALGYGAYAVYNRFARPALAPPSPQKVVLKQEDPPPARVSPSRPAPAMYPPRPGAEATGSTTTTSAPKPFAERRPTTQAAAGTAGSTAYAPSRVAESRQRERLKEPLPKIESILIDQDRRLAIIDGSVTSVGDRVGEREVAQIERDYVVLREPSGLRVRVSLRNRQ